MSVRMLSGAVKRSFIVLVALVLNTGSLYFLASSRASAIPSSTNLLGHWTYDQLNGTTLPDVSGNNLNGTTSGSPTLSTGKLGNAINVTANKSVSLGNIAGISGASKMTLATWMKRTTNNSIVLMGKQVAGADIAIELWNDGSVYFEVTNGSGFTSGKASLSGTAWNHVAFVYDGTQTGNASRLKGYVNGVQKTLTFSGTVPATTTTNTTPFTIGKLQNDFSNGQIDDTWLYNRALTSAEITDLATLSNDAVAPTVPTNLTLAAPAHNQVTASWTGSTDNVGVTGYRIYRGGVSIGTSATTSYTDNTAQASTSYNYTVAAYDAAGNTSAQSVVSSITTPVAPAPPTVSIANDVSSVSVGGSATITWGSTDATGCTASGGWAGVKAVSGSQVLSNLSATATYTLTCTSPGGSAAASVIIIVVDTDAPTVPQGLTATAVSQTQVNLSWTAATDNAAVTGYRIFKDGISLATVTGLTYQSTGLVAGTTYSYTVAAYDASTNESAQSTAAMATTFLPDTTAPTIPTGLTATNITHNSALVSWSPSTDDTAVTGYRLYANDQLVTTTSGTLFATTGLTPQTAYGFTVIAYDAAGNSSAASAVFSITTLTAPAGSNPGPWVNITGSVPLNAGSNNAYGALEIAVAKSNPQVVYVGTCNAGIWKSSNFGSSWTKVSTGTNANSINSGCNNFVGVDTENENIVYTASLHSAQGFWKSTDGGVNWTQKLPASMTSIFGVQDVYNISFDPADHLHFIVGGHAIWGAPYNGTGILESKDGGETWKMINPNLRWSTSSPALMIDSNIWMICTADGYWRTTNAGTSWTGPVKIGTDTPVCSHGGSAVYRASNGNLFMAALNQIMRSSDNGATWIDATPPDSSRSGFYSIIGDGTNLYVQANPAWTTAAAPYWTSPETNGLTWTQFNPSQTFPTGPFAMAKDPVNRIIYSSNWVGGIWKFTY